MRRDGLLHNGEQGCENKSSAVSKRWDTSVFVVEVPLEANAGQMMALDTPPHAIDTRLSRDPDFTLHRLS